MSLPHAFSAACGTGSASQSMYKIPDTGALFCEPTHSPDCLTCLFLSSTMDCYLLATFLFASLSETFALPTSTPQPTVNLSAPVIADYNPAPSAATRTSKVVLSVFIGREFGYITFHEYSGAQISRTLVIIPSCCIVLCCCVNRRSRRKASPLILSKSAVMPAPINLDRRGRPIEKPTLLSIPPAYHQDSRPCTPPSDPRATVSPALTDIPSLDRVDSVESRRYLSVSPPPYQGTSQFSLLTLRKENSQTTIVRAHMPTTPRQ